MESNEVDIVENGAVVKVFLLEGALPWNAPADVREAAGPFWDDFALTHSALGFLVEESGSKHVLEYYAGNYVGAFMPTLPPLPPTPAPMTPPPTTVSPTASPTSWTPSAAPVDTPNPTSSPTSWTPSAAPVDTPNPTPSPTTPLPLAAGNDIGENRASEAELEHGTAHEFAEGKFSSDDWQAAMTPGNGGNGGGWGVEDVKSGEGLPVAAAGNGTADVIWDNAATLRTTSGFDPSLWVSANYVAKITGLLYNDLSGWSDQYLQEHLAYQPLSACGGSAEKGKKTFKSTGSADSYDFVWSAFERLASNGVIFEREVVLPPKRTVMCLFAKGDDADGAEFVSAKGNDDALEYYRRTNDCISKLAAAAAAGNATYPGGGACTSRAIPRKSASAGGGGGAGSMYADGEAEGAVSLLLGLGGCLQGESHAFLYHNESALVRLPLPSKSSGNDTIRTTAGSSTTMVSARKSGTTPTAGLVRYAPAMPPPPPPPPGGSDRAWIVYIAVTLVALGFIAAAIRALFRRKLRVDMMRAYGGGGGGGGGGGAVGGLFSSQAGTGWRSGGRDAASASDFGEFDSGVGGGYGGGPMFPGDSYGSGNLGGMSTGSAHGSRMSWRSRGEHGGGGGGDGGGGGGGKGRSSPNAENVELKRPLLNASESPLKGVPPPARSLSPPPARSGRRRSFSGSKQLGGGGRFSREGTALSPPPFSRMQGTIGAGPVSSLDKKERGSSRRRGEAAGSGGKDDGDGDLDMDRGPFGNDPFVGGGGSGGGMGGVPGTEVRDEVFC